MASYKKYQTKKGTKWKFQLFMGRDPHGKQIIKTRSGYDTKKEASTAAVALEKQLNNESLLDNQYLTFKQVPELFILFVLNKIWRKITLVSEKSFFC